MTVNSKLRDNVKKLFQRGFSTSRDIAHPLFDASKTEVKRLMTTRRGLQEIRDYDPKLHQATTRFVKKEKLSSVEFLKKHLQRWTSQLRRKTGDTKTTYRTAKKVLHTDTKAGRVTRPLQLLHMDLADMNRLNPDRMRYRYPFVLVTVDGYTNYSVLVPVKDKSGQSVVNAVKNTFHQLGLTQRFERLRKAKRRRRKRKIVDDDDYDLLKNVVSTVKVQTDRGTEFTNDELRRFLKSRNATLFHSRGSGKAYLAESKIGQMKRQLVRIADIMEKTTNAKIKKKKKKKKKTTTTKKKKKKKDDDDDDDTFDDYNVYKDDWSRHLRVLQTKLNAKRNTRSGYTPKELFDRFTRKNNKVDDWEMKRRSNETRTRFEPLNDTLVKMNLLKSQQKKSATDSRAVTKLMRRDEKQNKEHAWRRRRLRRGDVVYLTKARLKGYPSEQQLQTFNKRSTDTKGQWDTDQPYVVDRVVKSVQTPTTNVYRYRLRNRQTNALRRTLYYREELLLSKVSHI